MRHIRLTATLLLTLHLPACTSYQVLADPAASLQATPEPIKKARVTVDTGKRFEVMSPRVNGDSLQGSLRDGAPVSVAMATVQEVEVRAYDGTKTILLNLGAILVLVGAAIGIGAYILGGG